jgi:hypothetical protein
MSNQRYGVASRTFEEDDEEAVTSSRVESILLRVLYTEHENAPVSTIIVCSDISTKPLAAAIAESSLDMKKVGSIVCKNDKINGPEIASVHYAASSESLLVVVENCCSNEAAPSMPILFENKAAKRLIVLGGFNVSSYIGVWEEGSLRKVLTLPFHFAIEPSFVYAIPSIAPGNLMTGLTAAWLSFAIYRNIPAVGLLSRRQVSLSVASMKAYEAAIPLLQNALKLSQFTKPATSAYVAALKRDPYVTNTENLYS